MLNLRYLNKEITGHNSTREDARTANMNPTICDRSVHFRSVRTVQPLNVVAGVDGPARLGRVQLKLDEHIRTWHSYFVCPPAGLIVFSPRLDRVTSADAGDAGEDRQGRESAMG